MEHPFFINGPPTNRSEALRWLSIAEKLLTNRDLVGSKSFATRARESDPTLAHPIDQILTIVDTLTAGDKRINNHHFDYYSILQIPHNQTQNFEFIADQYRRFALLLNPQNNNFPFSDQAFGLVVDAFSVLSDPLRKSMYDKELGFFLNLYPVASAPTPVSFVQHGGFSQMPGSGADQLFVNLPSQDQGSHATGVSFSRDPQAGISMPVTFLNRDQETMTMASSGSEQEQQQQQQQPVTSLRQQTQQPVSSLSFSNTDEQPATFLNLNQPQPVTSERSLNRENPPFGIGLSSTRGREPEVSVEQRGNQQPPERNENVVGNNENRSASTVLVTMRAFQAVKIAAPPIIDGKEAYFCCWGFLPLGFSVENFERSRNNVSSWSPFSPMFTCPSSGVNEGRNANNHAVGGQSNVSTFGNLHSAGGSKSRGGRKHSAPRIYSDDDDDDEDDDDEDVLVDLSEPTLPYGGLVDAFGGVYRGNYDRPESTCPGEDYPPDDEEDPTVKEVTELLYDTTRSCLSKTYLIAITKGVTGGS
ncbi:hypothetical protein HAX54_013825 [Datura stramonium]|uniref:J domain-containing protein n=1 Tax=Datura stramonium TaxID=4076 RepID=A0ABS8TPI5_DATST|nr:hypothetical protein [Datura stramonium]